MYLNRINQVGDDFTVRRTNNSGTSWQSVAPSTLASVASNFDLHLVQTVNYNDAYVLGAAGAARVNQQAIATKVASFPTDIIASDANAAQLVALKDNGTIYRYATGSSGLTSAGTMTNSGVPLTCVALQGPNNIMAGGTNIFKYFNSTNTEVTYSGTSITGNILAIDVKNANAVMVGENGLYYRMKSTGANANGVLTGVNWTAIAGLANEDQIITALGDADLTTVAIASTTQIVYGGQYDPTFISSLTNPVEVPWVRSAFDPGERYSSRFYYDKLGRLIVSENARQYNGNERKFSYTLYDELGRVVEVGEKTENSDFVFRDVFGSMVSGHYNPRVIDDAKLDAWINGDGIRQEVTRSYYDVFNTTFYSPPYAVNQDNQRKRIAHVAYYSAFPFDDQNNPIAFEDYDHATHFVYDIHGNVTKLMQDNRKMAVEYPTLADHRVKTMEYSYDLVSGNVHRMSVQTGEADQWHHAYSYDADNRITEVRTSTQTPIIDISMPAQFLDNELTENSDWTVEAKYFYYAHGPLARTELGSQLQGLDYIYNLQGWLKGVNATSLNNDFDPGADGAGLFSKDVMAFSLHYYNGDYTPIGGASITPSIGIDYTNTTLNSGVGNELNLYNGNIRFMQTTLTDIPTGDALPMLNAYKYDQLNRLLEARSYETGLSSNVWNPSSYGDEYLNTFTYDANGNILTQNRHLRDGTQTDELTYNYLLIGGNLVRNRLYHVNDAIAGATYVGDLEDQDAIDNTSVYNFETNNNYRYDEEGRLIRDRQEGIEEIVWRVDGKVKKVIFTSASGKNNLEFDYDAFGRRIAKHVYLQDNSLVRSTYYILDAQGNQLSTYEHSASTEDVSETFSFELAERVMYGSSRLGINVNKVDLFGNSEEDYLNLTLGNKLFEMSNHLGNVLTVINDIKVPYLDGSDVAYYATIVSTADYSPFGVQLDGRTVSAETYRYGYQGSEKDDEVKGEGNSYTTQFRMLDPRLGRWLSIDPLAVEFPWQSPYVSMDNNPICLNDVYGDSTGSNGAPPIVQHKVQQGQTLSLIAKQFNTTVDAIKNANKSINWEQDRNNGGLIFAGETLNVPDNRQQNNVSTQSSQKPPSFETPEAMSIWLSANMNNGSTYIITEGVVPTPVENQSYISTAVNIAGVTYSILEFTCYNKELGTWLGKNGVIYSGTSGRGPNGSTGSRAGAKSAANNYKMAGRIVFVVGAAFSVAEIADAYNSGNTDKVVDETGKLLLGAMMTFGGPVGFVFGGVCLFFYDDLKALSKSNPAGTPYYGQYTCFVAGTTVQMFDGSLKEIQDIVEGDLILSLNMHTLNIEVDTVLQLPSHVRRYKIIRIVLDDGNVIEFSPCHPFWVVGKGWCVFDVQEAKNELSFNVNKMEERDFVLCYVNGKLEKRQIVSLEDTGVYIEMYNVEHVKNNNNFFANGILVHNKFIDPKYNNESSPLNSGLFRVLERYKILWQK